MFFNLSTKPKFILFVLSALIFQFHLDSASAAPRGKLTLSARRPVLGILQSLQINSPLYSSQNTTLSSKSAQALLSPRHVQFSMTDENGHPTSNVQSPWAGATASDTSLSREISLPLETPRAETLFDKSLADAFIAFRDAREPDTSFYANAKIYLDFGLFLLDRLSNYRGGRSVLTQTSAPEGSALFHMILAEKELKKLPVTDAKENLLENAARYIKASADNFEYSVAQLEYAKLLLKFYSVELTSRELVYSYLEKATISSDSEPRLLYADLLVSDVLKSGLDFSQENEQLKRALQLYGLVVLNPLSCRTSVRRAILGIYDLSIKGHTLALAYVKRYPGYLEGIHLIRPQLSKSAIDSAPQTVSELAAPAAQASAPILSSILDLSPILPPAEGFEGASAFAFADLTPQVMAVRETDANHDSSRELDEFIDKQRTKGAVFFNQAKDLLEEGKKEKSVELLRIAAEFGYAEAQYEYARFLKEESFPPSPVTNTLIEKYFGLAKEQGHPAAELEYNAIIVKKLAASARL